ncbi:MAG: transglycosylase SLT domain-containing protein [Deltaproteobacteria bacterium]|nr:MAG: transglycosylase SLT domain-containing protein [Deltaproteobacteria bacterium]
MGKIAWSQYRLGHYREALDSYEEAIQQGETAQLLYWKARSLEKNKKNKTGEKPQEVYQNIIQMYPATYYAVRAAERLNRLGIGTDYKSWWTPVGLQWSEEEKEFSASSYLDKIYTLTSLDLIADAEVEIRLARQNNDDSQWEGLPLPNDPRRFVKKSDAYRFHFRIPTQDTEYRLPYADFLFSEIKRHQNFIDPFLVYAIMRQESRYRPSIVSPVGAIGLLQIMPYTGRKLSKEAGWSVFTPSWLRDPLTNIELSVFYLKKLDNLFAGKWYATVASYNAGEFAVSQWLKQRHGLSEEEFIEEIPYGETRDYVKKIYTNWKAYQTIY